MPHEVDMTKALIMSLEEWWLEEPKPQPVSRVVLEVGAFTCVEPDLLVRSFAQQRLQKAFLQSAELEIKPVPFVAHCDQCDRTYQPDIGLEYRCPTCEAGLHNIKSGRELKIAQVEWANESS
ncbi:MAG: hydrogenase maturation nickel metallochaperone HypA [Chloroflexota bacterium]